METMTRHVGITALLTMSVIAGFGAPPHTSFEVASVRLNPDCVGDRQDEQFSPGRVSVTCITLANLIQAAYVTFADGLGRNPVRLRVFGLPEWARSTRFNITAQARSDAPMEQMFGPMLQSLLEERFGLALHRETRELPVYTMNVAKNGLRIQPTKEGSCVPMDLKHANEASPKFCGRMTGKVNGGRIIDDAYGMTMAEIGSRFLANRLDRPVIDRTGIAGIFDAHLEFLRDTGTDADADAPSIFTAVQEQLGLKLSADKGPVEVLVIDRVTQLSAN
jgi:uncharacterized protein (TIGR03435 family)